MARGKKCPECGHSMYATDEQEEQHGTWVWYQCRNAECGYTLKEFESKQGYQIARTHKPAINRKRLFT